MLIRAAEVGVKFNRVRGLPGEQFELFGNEQGFLSAAERDDS